MATDIINAFMNAPFGGKMVFISLGMVVLVIVASAFSSLFGKEKAARIRSRLGMVAAVILTVCFFGGLSLYFSDGGTEPESHAVSNTSFADIYRATKANKLTADEKYKGNRYQITAKINGIGTGGLLNFTGGATLTMEYEVDDTIVFFLAEFERNQEEALKRVVVGDTITFEGKWQSGSFSECEVM